MERLQIEGKGTVAILRWRTGALGCLLPIMLLATMLFGVATVRPALSAELAEARGGALLRLGEEITLGGVNLLVALLTLYMAWTVVLFAWRWADEIAVTADRHGLTPHRSIRIKPLAWEEIADVALGKMGRASALIITLTDRRTRSIRGVEIEGEAADAFIARARDWLARDR